MNRIEEDGNYIAWYKEWKFTIVPMLIDYEPETREYRVYVYNPNLFFPDGDCEAPEDYESLDEAKSRVKHFVDYNF